MDSQVTANAYPEEILAQGHPAMNLALLRPYELERGGESKANAVDYLAQYCRMTLEWMKSHRATVCESDWRYCEQEYTLAAARRKDNNRIASVIPNDPDLGAEEDEYDSERSSCPMPIGFEAVEQMVPRYYDALVGGDVDAFVDLVGRDAVDQQKVHTVRDWLNYQQGWQINTPRIFHGWLRNGGLYNIGILMQWWDHSTGRRRVENVSPWNAWFDPAARDIEDCRYVVIRRTITHLDLLNMRDEGKAVFTDEALASVMPLTLDDSEINNPTFMDADSEAKDPNRQAYLDYFMEKDRWILIVNEQLVISIQEPEVPPVKNSQGKVVQRDHPIHLFVPLPSIESEHEYPGVYGMSVVSLARTMTDMENSILFIMHEGLSRAALGLTFVDPDEATEFFAEKRSLRPGEAIPCRKAKDSIFQMNFPDTAGPCQNAIALLDSRIERITGVNNALRGMPTYSTETAYGKQQDLSQATHRIKMGILLGYGTMRKYWDVALRLNQTYLEEDEFIRVIGERASWHPITKNDLTGVSGKDLIPTGMPLSANRASLAQTGLNLLTVLQQLRAGGESDIQVRPLVRDILKAMEYRRTDEVVPERLSVGQDPKQENELILQGQPVLVGMNDDHENHLQTHYALSMHPQVREELKANQQMLLLLETHMAQHAQALEGYPDQQEASGAQKRGPGVGTAGLNSEVPTPQPKNDQQIQAGAGGNQ